MKVGLGPEDGCSTGPGEGVEFREMGVSLTLTGIEVLIPVVNRDEPGEFGAFWGRK